VEFLIGNWVYRKTRNGFLCGKNAKLLNRLAGIFCLVFPYPLVGIPHIDTLQQSEKQENDTVSQIVYDAIAPIPPETWFLDSYLQLITREVTMGQAVNCQYVWNAINAKKNRVVLFPVPGTEHQAANRGYLLKMIDKAYGNEGNYGASVYAAKQIIDTAAVTQAPDLILDGKFAAIAKNSNKAAYSTDGITWTITTLLSTACGYSVT
jgi:hypothetical protein